MLYEGASIDKPEPNEVTIDIIPVIRVTYYHGIFSIFLCWLLWGIRFDFLKEAR